MNVLPLILAACLPLCLLPAQGTTPPNRALHAPSAKRSYKIEWLGQSIGHVRFGRAFPSGGKWKVEFSGYIRGKLFIGWIWRWKGTLPVWQFDAHSAGKIGAGFLAPGGPTQFGLYPPHHNNRPLGRLY